VVACFGVIELGFAVGVQGKGEVLSAGVYG
jgi:hypothetical protein